MRFFALLALTLMFAAPAARAQQDSVFESYSDYAAFVDRHIMTRDFIPLILRLGGRDEYTQEQLETTAAQLQRAWPVDFQSSSVFREENLGGGIRQEGRIYWTGTSYAYFYALLHYRTDGFVVISFHLNTNSSKVLERF